MCWMFSACTYDQVMGLISMVLIIGGLLAVLLVLVIGLVMVEMQKAKRSGINVDAILDDARRRTPSINGRPDDAL